VADARLRLLQLLRSRAEMCPAASIPKPWNWRAVEARRYLPLTHDTVLEPMDGQPGLAAGRHRYLCRACGFDRVIVLTGEEVWLATA
jgi:hypothetical protein